MDQAEKPPASVSNSSKTCCAISVAPLPEEQSWAGNFAVAAPPASASNTIVPKSPLENAWSPDIARDSSPPPLQLLLCTFLN